LTGVKTLAQKTFEGLKSLTELDLSENQLAHLDKKPFEGLTNLTRTDFEFSNDS